MDIDLNYHISLLSTEELNERIHNRQKYLPETIEASVAELQHRGYLFAEAELSVISEDLRARRAIAATAYQGPGIFNSSYKSNLVEDPAAPLLYSRRAIYIFTVLCGALFGAIMFAINCGNLKNGRGIFWALMFGVGFTLLQVMGRNYVNIGSSYAIFCGIVAAICIDYLFWNLFLGRATLYKARAIWPPVIVAIVIGLSLLIFLLGMVQHYW